MVAHENLSAFGGTAFGGNEVAITSLVVGISGLCSSFLLIGSDGANRIASRYHASRTARQSLKYGVMGSVITSSWVGGHDRIRGTVLPTFPKGPKSNRSEARGQGVGRFSRQMHCARVLGYLVAIVSDGNPHLSKLTDETLADQLMIICHLFGGDGHCAEFCSQTGHPLPVRVLG